MKKYLALAMVAVLLVCSLASCATGLGVSDAIGEYAGDKNYMTDEAGNTFYFQEAEGETAILIGYAGKATRDDKVKIPESFNGRTVTAIGDEAFYNLASIIEVEIPKTVTKIGEFAFAGCTSLPSITLPAGVLEIDDRAFTGCTALTSVKWGLADEKAEDVALTTIGNDAFRSCTALVDIPLPATLKTIGDGAFFGCSALTELVIPESVESIGDLAYYECTGLESIKLHDKLTEEGLGKFIFSLDQSTLKDKIDISNLTEGSDAWKYVDAMAEPTVEETESAAESDTAEGETTAAA